MPRKRQAVGHAETCSWRFGMNTECDCGLTPLEGEVVEPVFECWLTGNKPTPVVKHLTVDDVLDDIRQVLLRGDLHDHFHVVIHTKEEYDDAP